MARIVLEGDFGARSAGGSGCLGFRESSVISCCNRCNLHVDDPLLHRGNVGMLRMAGNESLVVHQLILLLHPGDVVVERLPGLFWIIPLTQFRISLAEGVDPGERPGFFRVFESSRGILCGTGRPAFFVKPDICRLASGFAESAGAVRSATGARLGASLIV
jgi:hypothetical protein